MWTIKRYINSKQGNTSEISDGDLKALHRAVLSRDFSTLQRLFIVQRKDINMKDKKQRTALHIACTEGHVDLVQFLIRNKADLNLRDDQNKSALMRAVQAGHKPCVTMLLQNNAATDLVDSNKNTALHLAAQIQSMHMATLLVEHRADVNASNKDGQTALAIAVLKDDLTTAKLLLQSGADVNVADCKQKSPLILAAAKGLTGMTKLLLDNGADVSLKDYMGWSARQHANKSGKQSCANLFKKQKKRVTFSETSEVKYYDMSEHGIYSETECGQTKPPTENYSSENKRDSKFQSELSEVEIPKAKEDQQRSLEAGTTSTVSEADSSSNTRDLMSGSDLESDDDSSYDNWLESLKVKEDAQTSSKRLHNTSTFSETDTDTKKESQRNTVSVQLEPQTEVDHLKHQLKQKKEKSKEASMVHKNTKDQIKRVKEQAQAEVREKQKMEVTLRPLQKEQLNSRHQTQVRQEVKKDAADKDRLELEKSALEVEINTLREELESSQTNSSLKQSLLLDKNRTLKAQLKDAQREAKANSDTLSKTEFNCNQQLSKLKSELIAMTNCWNDEKRARETLQKEVDSTRTPLSTLTQEAKANTDKALRREREENHQLSGDSVGRREEVSFLSQKLPEAALDTDSLEGEVQRVILQLMEKEKLVDALQNDKKKLSDQLQKLHKALIAEKEKCTKTEVHHQATLERLATAQSEVMLLQQQLEEAKTSMEVKEKQFNGTLSKLHSECAEKVSQMKEENKEQVRKTADLQNQVYKLEKEKDRNLKDLDMLKEKLKLSEFQCAKAEERFTEKTREHLPTDPINKLKKAVQRLETENATLLEQLEKEKKKTEKMTEVETLLNLEKDRNLELQTEMDKLCGLVKKAKSKLREQERNMNQTKQDSHKVDNLQQLLDRERMQRSQLEKDISVLQEKLSSLMHCEHKHQEQLQELRQQLECAQREHSEVKERTRHDLQHKLDQVNVFLQTQAARQEADTASLRSQLENRIWELQRDLSHAHVKLRDAISEQHDTRMELERYKSLYAEESVLRKSLVVKLERANGFHADHNSKMPSQNGDFLITSKTLDSSVGNLGQGQSLGLTPRLDRVESSADLLRRAKQEYTAALYQKYKI